MSEVMKYIFLSKDFFNDYSKCTEIEQKLDRPYIMLLIQTESKTFALPMRSHIKHKFAYMTDKLNCSGVDYSKAVVITDKKYIDSRKPKIRQNEYNALLGKEYIIEKEFKKYLSDYKKAKEANAIRFVKLYKFSTLQYFHKELGIE